jgi:hypothetical protein
MSNARALLSLILLAAVFSSASPQTWTAQNSGTENWLFGVAFVDANTGWAVGDNGALRHTTDGGGTWTAQSSGTTMGLWGLAFVDSSDGWAVGYSVREDHGIILHTTDGGTAWSVQSNRMTTWLEGVAFVDANHGWAVGWGGTILHYGVPEPVTDRPSDLQPSSFVLSAFPNPFNPMTTIRYDVKTTGLVSLKVYDLLGRQVATLLHGTVPVGSHSIEWNAGDLPSGVYLCQMQAQGFMQTQKMMLVK